eukprot:3407239-Rhodomonas_salina.1
MGTTTPDPQGSLALSVAQLHILENIQDPVRAAEEGAHVPRLQEASAHGNDLLGLQRLFAEQNLVGLEERIPSPATVTFQELVDTPLPSSTAQDGSLLRVGAPIVYENDCWRAFGLIHELSDTGFRVLCFFTGTCLARIQ